MNVSPVTLSGSFITLEPLSLDEHLAGLVEAGDTPKVFRWFRHQLADPGMMEQWIANAVTGFENGIMLPFATIHQESGTVIGSTRFGNISTADARVEIGWTWITPAYQRTRANTEAKYLMLRHAFEQWDCMRVEFKTDTRNHQSRSALERIGASEEGVLRQHMNTHAGIRDTVYFSILDTEWPHVKTDLEQKLAD